MDGKRKAKARGSEPERDSDREQAREQGRRRAIEELTSLAGTVEISVDLARSRRRPT